MRVSKNYLNSKFLCLYFFIASAMTAIFYITCSSTHPELAVGMDYISLIHFLAGIIILGILLKNSL